MLTYIATYLNYLSMIYCASRDHKLFVVITVFILEVVNSQGAMV